MRKKYIVEIGMGADLHGQDVTKAGRKAVKDAISHSCLCGLQEILTQETVRRFEQIRAKLEKQEVVGVGVGDRLGGTLHR